MKLAAIIVLAFILLTVMILLVAGMALSAMRRARLRGEQKGTLDFSDTETIRFTREAHDVRNPPSEEDDNEDQPGSL